MTKTTLLNPNELICQLFKIEDCDLKYFTLGHIKYDENIDNDFDYQIIRESSHDGTLIFTSMLIAKALEPLVNKTTYCSKDITEDQLKNISDIEYTIGNITLESTYGSVDLQGRMMHGVSNKVRIPVRCKYTFGSQNG